MNPGSKTSAPEVRIDVCVCTYRRRELEDTLRSLGAMTVPENARVRVIVADNDVEPSARERAYALAAQLPFEIVYIHCPASNISLARNACLENSTGDFLAFIDDDSTASREWLSQLMEVAQATGADVVLGPVIASYSDDAPHWMRQGDFHSTSPVWVDGEIRTGYSGNALLRLASRRVSGRRFNLALGRTGGEDTEYFTHLHDAGGIISFAPHAVVHEPVPDNRARFSWLMKRRFRAGQTHGRLLAEKHRSVGAIRHAAIASAKAAYCFAAMAVLAFLPTQRNRFALRGVMHVGALSGLFGVREITQYGTETAGRRSNAA